MNLFRLRGEASSPAALCAAVFFLTCVSQSILSIDVRRRTVLYIDSLFFKNNYRAKTTSGIWTSYSF